MGKKKRAKKSSYICDTCGHTFRASTKDEDSDEGVSCKECQEGIGYKPNFYTDSMCDQNEEE